MIDFYGDRKKRIKIAIGVILVVIVALILLAVGIGNKGGKLKDKSNNNNKGKIGGNASSNFKPDYNYGGSERPRTNDNIAITVPKTMYGGKVISYVDKSTFAELTMLGGKSKKGVKFKLIPTGIVFDTKKNKVVKPSELKEGLSVKIIATGAKNSGVETVEVVIIDDKADLAYTPVVKVDKSENALAIVNPYTETKYKVGKETKVLDAVTGRVYDKNRLKEGDRVFVYKGKEAPTKASKGGKTSTEVDINKIYVLPAPRVRETENKNVTRGRNKK